MALLPNQIQDHSPKKADLRTPGCGEGKVQHLLLVTSKKSGSLVLTRPKVPDGFQQGIFRG